MSKRKKGKGTDSGAGHIVRRGKKGDGEEVHDDKSIGDKIQVGDISSSKGIAIGRGAQATVSEGVSGEEIARLFDEIYARVDARPEDPDVSKDELTETVRKVQQEVAKVEEANPNKIGRWLKTLAMMAPDIFEVATATLANPASGIASVIRKVAEKAKADAGQA